MAPADAAVPSVIVSPVRALLQRLGPHVEDTEPLQVERGPQVDLDELVEQLAHLGYRREYQVEHRGEMAVRGSIVDVFPSTALSPVRIDLWGDEVDRLTEFSVADQRSVTDLDEVVVFGCRELLPSPEVRERAGALGETEPWGRGSWERLAEGLSFDGMESWLPWLTADEHLLIDLLPRGAKVFLVEPRRMRERAVEIAEEEADLAGALATTWGAEGRDFPRLYLPFDRLLSGTSASVAMITPVPEGPGTPTISTMGWDPVAGGQERLLAQLRELRAKRFTVVVCAENEEQRDAAGPLAAGRGRHGGGRRRAWSERPPRCRDGRRCSRRRSPDRQGVHIPVAPIGGAGRRGPDGPPAAAPDSPAPGGPGGHLLRRHEDRRLRRAFSAWRGPFRRHGQTFHRRCRARLLIAGIPGRGQTLRAIGPGRCLTPVHGRGKTWLSRLNGTEWQKTKARVRKAVREIAHELVALYKKRALGAGSRLRPRHPVAEWRWSTPSPITRRQTS